MERSSKIANLKLINEWISIFKLNEFGIRYKYLIRTEQKLIRENS